MLITIAKLTTFVALQEGTETWWNYPGLELWKLVNLLLFVGVLTWLLRRPIGNALRVRRESIRFELMRAHEERNAALAKLKEVEARIARANEEVEQLREQATREAADERARIARSTEQDAEKLRDQARREIESAGKAARQELRRYAAEESVRLAEDVIRRDMRPEDDVRLVNEQVEELGGLRH